MQKGPPITKGPEHKVEGREQQKQAIDGEALGHRPPLHRPIKPSIKNSCIRPGISI